MRAPQGAAGKHGACPHCKTVMEIPVVELEGQLDKIRLGECTVLVEKGTHHKVEEQILIRFQCRCCEKTLGIPVEKAHKKIQCSQCNTLLRLALDLVENRPDAIPHDAPLDSDLTNAATDNPPSPRIEFECPECKKPVKVPQQHGGKKGKCPHCQSKVNIPHYSTITRFRVPSQTRAASPAITIGVGDQDLLKGFIPDKPLTATVWSTEALGPTIPTQPSSQRARSRQTTIPSHPREGLAWESAKAGESRLWATTKQLLLRPGEAFSQMFEDDGLGNPFGFAVAGHLLGSVYLAISSLPVIAVACWLAKDHMQNGIDYTQLAIQYGIGLGIWLGGGAVIIPLMMFGGGAVLHTGMLLIGGSNKPFSTTTRMIGYSLGAVAQLTILSPLLAPFFIVLSFVIQLGFGMTRAHQKKAGHAFAALMIFFLVPIIFIGLLTWAAK